MSAINTKNTLRMSSVNVPRQNLTKSIISKVSDKDSFTSSSSISSGTDSGNESNSYGSDTTESTESTSDSSLTSGQSGSKAGKSTNGGEEKKQSKAGKVKNIAYYISKIVQLQKQQENEESTINGLNEKDVKRYALFPILDEKGYEFYQRQEITHWSESELDFVADRKFYDNASPQVRHVVDTILAFFLSGDGAISDNIIYRFLLECSTYEEKAMFISQLHIELVHAATYGLAAFTFKRDPKTMGDLIESAMKTSCIQHKIDFMEKWMLADRPRYQRLVAFACAEGIFFCTLFAVIFWFRSKGMFPNFILANELIANDESLHRDWGAYLFGQELSKYAHDEQEVKNIKDSVYQIIEEALVIEDEFVDYILKDKLDDLNAADLKVYARLIADNLLHQLSYSSVYNVKNPFTWLDDISMEQKGNFYEVRIGAYKKKSLAEVMNWKKRAGLVEETGNVYANPDDVDF